MLYLDTSAIVKLYIKEKGSKKLGQWLRKNGEPIPLTLLHELEFTNALKLKQFRNELEEPAFGHIISLLHGHMDKGVYFRPVVDWPQVLLMATNLSLLHTGAIGARSLDILHVAVGINLQCTRFITFDSRQAAVAQAAGLNVKRRF